jgi:glutathione synthase/RimK-type ligase-like ATP-grasp enzyme
MQLCLIGDPDDLTGTYLRWRAQQRGIAIVVLPENRLGESWTFNLSAPTAGYFEIEGSRLPFADVDGAIVRLNPKPELPENVALSAEEANVFTVERRHTLHWLLDTAPFPVCNSPRAGRSNASKPYQMQQLARAGFRVPEWIVTNQSDVVRRFADRVAHGLIYKACSGLRSHVRRVDEEFHRCLREGSAPVVVQEYIVGTEARIHVVGRQTFCVGIESEAVDYRFDGGEPQYCSFDAPAEIQQRCIDFAAREELLLAGFDFRRSEAGEWMCLEMNPVPTFLPYEAATGVPIADCVLDEIIARGGD